MFEGFSKEAFDFLFDIRINNNKEWFEPRKKIYTQHIYEPLKALTAEIFKPFENTGMISKTGRIYRDESYPPYLHYRDTLWIYIRYNAWDWSKTPTLYFEISPEGAEFGFRISKHRDALRVPVLLNIPEPRPSQGRSVPLPNRRWARRHRFPASARPDHPGGGDA